MLCHPPVLQLNFSSVFYYLAVVVLAHADFPDFAYDGGSNSFRIYVVNLSEAAVASDRTTTFSTNLLRTVRRKL